MYCEFLYKKFGKQNYSVGVDAACFLIINLTPDSFSDGSELNTNAEYQLLQIDKFVELGIDAIDIGAESTRPNAIAPGTDEEYRRLESFLDLYKHPLDLSIDTRNPEIIKKVFQDQGKGKKIKYINDVSGMQNLEFLEACAENCPEETKYIAMHSKGGIPPLAARELPDNFYDEDGGLELHLFKFFEQTLKLCEKFSIKEEQLIFDPGFGFGKNFNQSFELIDLSPKLKKEFGRPIFVGTSRKSFLKLWQDKINELGFKQNPLRNRELDYLTLEFNNLLRDVDYFRMHG